MTQLYFIVGCNFLCMFVSVGRGLSSALKMIGLILVKERIVEDLHLTDLTVIKHYSGQGRWILRKISL